MYISVSRGAAYVFYTCMSVCDGVVCIFLCTCVDKGSVCVLYTCTGVSVWW